ncbi:MAG: Rpn family recombination-promoting nuclease/putative transposase [Treponema sp.]
MHFCNNQNLYSFYYNQLANTVIIFLCTFDYLNKGLPLYTIQPTCTETNGIFQDGTVKIIVNSTAAGKADGELKDFLDYMNGKSPKTEFTKKLENLVNRTKQDEQKRREYMLIQSFEMDARRSDIQQGKSLGLAEGARNKALETAKKLFSLGLSVENIAEATGLSRAEVAALQ